MKKHARCTCIGRVFVPSKQPMAVDGNCAIRFRLGKSPSFAIDCDSLTRHFHQFRFHGKPVRRKLGMLQIKRMKRLFQAVRRALAAGNDVHRRSTGVVGDHYPDDYYPESGTRIGQGRSSRRRGRESNRIPFFCSTACRITGTSFTSASSCDSSNRVDTAYHE